VSGVGCQVSGVRPALAFLILKPYMKLCLAGTANRLNVEHRTPNIERPILMTLRFIYFKTNQPQNQPEADKFRKVDSLAQRRRRVMLSIFYKLTEYIIRCWTFNVRCSMFIF
jgi:hypothetical protein